MSRLETHPASNGQRLEWQTSHLAVGERRSARVSWRTHIVIPATLVLFTGAVLIYVSAAQ